MSTLSNAGQPGAIEMFGEDSLNSTISFRPVEANDEDFLLEVYAGSRADELALVPWTEEQKLSFVRMQFAAQTEHYKKFNPNGEHVLILRNSRPAGRLWVARRDEEIRILDIAILPSERNAGIGSAVIKRVLEAGKEKHKPVTIYVESFSRSRRLFERLGFVATTVEAVQVLMKWSPDQIVE